MIAKHDFANSTNTTRLV